QSSAFTYSSIGVTVHGIPSPIASQITTKRFSLPYYFWRCSMAIQLTNYPHKVQQILTLFRTMPVVEKQQVLEVLEEELTAETPPLTPLAQILQEQRPPVIHDLSQLAADLWADDEEFKAFLTWREEERELSKQLSEERFQRI